MTKRRAFSSPIGTATRFCRLPRLWTTTNVRSIFLDLPVLDLPCKWNPASRGLPGTGFCPCMQSQFPSTVFASGGCLPWLWQPRPLSPSSLLHISGSDSSCSKGTETNSLIVGDAGGNFLRRRLRQNKGGLVRGPSPGEERTSGRCWKTGNIL